MRNKKYCYSIIVMHIKLDMFFFKKIIFKIIGDNCEKNHVSHVRSAFIIYGTINVLLNHGLETNDGKDLVLLSKNQVEFYFILVF